MRGEGRQETSRYGARNDCTRSFQFVLEAILSAVQYSASAVLRRAFTIIRKTNNCSLLLRCIDYSDPHHPVLWVISPHAWYKVAGSGWWDFVAPHPLYAPVFEPSRRTFAISCLVARCLQSRCEPRQRSSILDVGQLIVSCIGLACV